MGSVTKMVVLPAMSSRAVVVEWEELKIKEIDLVPLGAYSSTTTTY